LLERDRADRGDGRDRLHLARCPALRPRAAQRACVPGDGADARDGPARVLALWFCIVPLRLRSAAVLLSSAIAAGVVVVWDFSTPALDNDNVAIAARSHAGHQLGVLLLAMVVLLSVVGVAFGFYTSRQAPSPISRRR